MSLAEPGRYSRNEALIITGRLESEGIAAIVFDGDMAIGDGSDLLIPVRVMVDADDFAEARAIIPDR